MGLVVDVLGAPFALPARGLMFIFNKIVEQVNNEMLDEGKIRMQLLELQSLLDSGQISEDEFYAAEEELLDRLDAILAFKEGQLLDASDEDDDEYEEEDDEADISFGAIGYGSEVVIGGNGPDDDDVDEEERDDPDEVTVNSAEWQ